MDLIGKNGSMAVLAIRKLGELQRQVSQNELRIACLEQESVDYKEQFARVNIVTASLKEHVRRLSRECEHLGKSLRALAIVLKLVVYEGVVKRKREHGLCTLKLILSVIGAIIIKRALYLDQLALILIPGRSKRTQILLQITTLIFLVATIKGNLENLF